ncbi:hypothetical protein Tco_1326856 [Tanacetum coccineum]
MHTRSQSRNLHNQQHQAPPPVVEQFNLEEPIENPDPLAPMDDNRTMAQLLEAPTADHFYDEVPERPEIRLVSYAFSIFLEGTRIWLEKEPPRSIQTWDDLVSKFINKFFLLSKTTNLQNEITRFQQRFDETFYESLGPDNDLSRAYSLNSAAGGNFLDKMPRDCLRIIESKSKVRNSRNKLVVAKVSSSTSTPGISSDVAELKDMVKALLLDKKNQSPAPTPVKAVEESCVTCGGPDLPNLSSHHWQCLSR